MIRTLAIDIETFSSVDLTKSGVYKYVESPDFEILLFAYSFDNDPVTVVDLKQGEQLPADVFAALQDKSIKKTAHNANFERNGIRKHFQLVLPPNQWECTMVKSSMLGLPLSLDQVSRVLKLEEEKGAGKALIRYFTMPCKPTKANGGRERNLPEHDPEKWAEFIEYNRQDVVVEKAIRTKIAFFEIPAAEQSLWNLDQRINDAGVLIDQVFINQAITQDIEYREKLTEEAIAITGLSNPNSAAQLKTWLTKEIGEDVGSLTKDAIPVLLKQTNDAVIKRVLGLRQEMSKTSVKKYEAMAKAVCSDGRIRGLLQFYGANRTGRWAGRLVQVQNLPRNEMKDLDLARKVARSGDLDALQLLFGNVPNVLSQLIRTAFVAPDNYRFIVSDFSAIEARVIAWLAGEKWRLDVFNTHGKIYEASAAQMFRVPLASVTKGSDLRQKGKVAELALGYQGGPKALEKMGALKMGIPLEELPKLVSMWRNANKAIVKFWESVGEAALEAVTNSRSVTICHGINFHVSKNILFITLSSGRRLSYFKPFIANNRNDFPALKYWGMDQTTKQWTVQETYGGKLVENIVQAIARDCLADAMLRLEKAGFKIVMHVHDEVVIEAPDECILKVDEVNGIMSTPIPWAKGLPLAADSYQTYYYKKD